MGRTRRWAAAAVLGLLVASSPAEPAYAQGSCTEHPPPGSGLGVPQGIDLDGSGLVFEVLVTVPLGHLRPFVADASALDITITSVNGTAHFHGTDVVPLSETALISSFGQLADVVVMWTEDQEPMVVNDIYTVCAQLVLGPPVGPENCDDFFTF